ncbi:unnamed protein product [Polarella glacialis]|uniref:Uncharacterized protein n=1 Tax=Polarella glacialis TaxID=89957 RepID=A0A813GFM0_POLGL|nr:unnamed protein product [Polarella glacialis]
MAPRSALLTLVALLGMAWVSSVAFIPTVKAPTTSSLRGVDVSVAAAGLAAPLLLSQPAMATFGDAPSVDESEGEGFYSFLFGGLLVASLFKTAFDAGGIKGIIRPDQAFSTKSGKREGGGA